MGSGPALLTLGFQLGRRPSEFVCEGIGVCEGMRVCGLVGWCVGDVLLERRAKTRMLSPLLVRVPGITAAR